jgi:hypothetical protein
VIAEIFGPDSVVVLLFLGFLAGIVCGVLTTIDALKTPQAAFANGRLSRTAWVAIAIASIVLISSSGIVVALLWFKWARPKLHRDVALA